MLKLRPIGSNQTEALVMHNNKEITILFSDQTPVAAFITGEGFFRTEKKWSVTTTRHINKWMESNSCPGGLIRPQSFFDNLIS